MLINVKVAILRSQLLLFIIVFQPNTCLFVSCFGSVPLLWVLLSVATAFEGGPLSLSLNAKTLLVRMSRVMPAAMASRFSCIFVECMAKTILCSQYFFYELYVSFAIMQSFLCCVFIF